MSLINKVWYSLNVNTRSKVRSVMRKAIPKQILTWLDVKLGFGVIKSIFSENGHMLIHVPKTAGMSIGEAVYGVKGISHCYAVTAKSQQQELYASLFTYAFVRNPWDRLVSAYFFVSQGGASVVKVNTTEEEMLVQHYPDFKKFVVEWLNHVDLRSAPLVFQPQYYFVCDELGSVIVDYVGRLETLEKDLKYISERIGKPIEMVRRNVSLHRDYREYYDKEMREIVEKVYAEDIRIFGYSFDS